MDGNLTYLFAAFFVTWLVIGVYLWSLSRQVQNLRDEVDALRDPAQTGAARPGASEPEQPEPARTTAAH